MLDRFLTMIGIGNRGHSADTELLRKFDTAQKLGEWGDHAGAIAILKDCIAKRPAMAALHFYLAENYAALTDTDKAVESYARALQLDADDRLGATIKLALLGAGEVPDILPRAYLQSLFDQFAPHFEASLVGNLGYDAPASLAAMLAQIGAGPFGRILDLGCGTGLSGEPFKKGSLWLEGVDLSPAMVREARKKNIYDVLHTETVDAFLDATEARYDLVVSSDTFIYRGALETVFEKIFTVLRDGGVFAFSIQQSALYPFALGRDQRFAHHEDYAMESLRNAGFTLLSSEHKTLRREHGNPVAGLLVAAARMESA